MTITAQEALWFLPFVLPICFYVAFTDLALMKITNKAVLVLGAVFVLLGPIVLPSIDLYFWRLLQIVVVLVAGIALNAAGVMGAGDAKFLAAAAPYVALGDLRLMAVLFAMVLFRDPQTRAGYRCPTRHRRLVIQNRKDQSVPVYG